MKMINSVLSHGLHFQAMPLLSHPLPFPHFSPAEQARKTCTAQAQSSANSTGATCFLSRLASPDSRGGSRGRQLEPLSLGETLSFLPPIARLSASLSQGKLLEGGRTEGAGELLIFLGNIPASTASGQNCLLWGSASWAALWAAPAAGDQEEGRQGYRAGKFFPSQECNLGADENEATAQASLMPTVRDMWMLSAPGWAQSMARATPGGRKSAVSGDPSQCHFGFLFHEGMGLIWPLA